MMTISGLKIDTELARAEGKGENAPWLVGGLLKRPCIQTLPQRRKALARETCGCPVSKPDDGHASWSAELGAKHVLGLPGS